MWVHPSGARVVLTDGCSTLGSSDSGWKWKNILVFAAIFCDLPFLAT